MKQLQNNPSGLPFQLLNPKQMKLFKNYVSYKGGREQLEMFAAELIKLGYSADPDSEYGVWSEGKTHVLTYTDGQFSFLSSAGRNKESFKIQEKDFEQAVKYASEKE